jgi:hypothetical protein
MRSKLDNEGSRQCVPVVRGIQRDRRNRVGHLQVHKLVGHQLNSLSDVLDHAGDQRVKPVSLSTPVDIVAWIVHPGAPPGRLSEWRLV